MILVDGLAGESISARDRGFAYGDGVFRTFKVMRGKPVLWQRQYAKLAHDCHALGIDCPPAQTLERDLAQIDTPDCIIKIVITRGDSARGYAMPSAVAVRRVVIAGAWPAHAADNNSKGIAARVCRLRYSSQPALAGIKHLNRLENVLARAEWNDADIAEGLMCDANANVIGGTMSNVFIEKQGALQTPDLRACGVSGVMRELVIELAKAHAVPVVVTAISLDQLLAADAVFVVNSVIGLWPVIQLDRMKWPQSKITMQMQQWIDDAQDA
ncbi:MAG: aminodeoxychorismate lyase [Betaproteobacteria bacterium]|nr:aminodeoxychorismate lyase [Betaproteobacteria bacterium]